MHSKGFTLIELIVVILIVAMLSATALPRYFAAQKDARIAKAQAIYGGIRSAASLAKSRCEIDLGNRLSAVGQCGNDNSQVTMDGQVVDMVNHYPSANSTGILTAAQISPGSDGVTEVNGSPYLIGVNGAPTMTNCGVSYVAAPSKGSPVITLLTSGC